MLTLLAFVLPLQAQMEADRGLASQSEARGAEVRFVDGTERARLLKRKPNVTYGTPAKKDDVPPPLDDVSDVSGPEPEAIPCDTCGPFLHERDARLLYRDFSASQFPRRATFSFDAWVVPPASRCANTREKGQGERRVTCTVCSDVSDPEERTLSANVLKDFAVVEKDFVFKFEGRTGPFAMKCGPREAWRSPIDVVEDLRDLGVSVRFRYPKEAQLRATPSGGTPDSAK